MGREAILGHGDHTGRHTHTYHGLASRGSPRPDEGQRSRAAVSMRPAPRLSAGPGGRSPAGWRDTPRKPPTASILRLSAREERLVHLALDPRYFEQADNRDRDYQGERDEVLRNHGHSVVPLRMCAADVGRPDGFTRFCIKAIKAGAQAERRPPMALHHSRTQLRPREVKPSNRD